MKLLKQSLFELPHRGQSGQCQDILNCVVQLKVSPGVDPSSPALTKLFDQGEREKATKARGAVSKLGLQPPNKGGNDGLKLFPPLIAHLDVSLTCLQTLAWSPHCWFSKPIWDGIATQCDYPKLEE